MARKRTNAKRKAAPVKGEWEILPHGMGIRRASRRNPENPVKGGQQGLAPNEVVRSDTGDTNAGSNNETDNNNSGIDDTRNIDPTQQSVPPAVDETTQSSLAIASDPIIEPHLNKGITKKAAKKSTRKSTSKETDLLDVPTSKRHKGKPRGIKEVAITLRRSNRLRALGAADGRGDDRNVASFIADAQLDEGISPKIEESDAVTPQNEIITLRRSKRVSAEANVKGGDDGEREAPPKRVKRAQDNNNGNGEDLPIKPKRVPRKTKDNPYGLTPGRSPFPDWQAPSAAQCEEAYKLLSSMHGEWKQPEVIPTPSLEVAGCGEVPYVLDAMLRTLLSGAVTFDGADKMVKNLVANYGVLKDKLAEGSIDWNKVRQSSIEDLEAVLRVGGLANRKAKSIKSTLDMVYDENIKRRDAFLAEKATGVVADVYGASERTQSQKDLEILKTERNILSLDHMWGLPVDKALREFTRYPGIGVKTAACVTLFCLQRPCFAVDTHVHRFSRWLGWVPDNADEDKTFSHLEVRCPDHLKYGLHQLFIRHGQTCGRCKTGTVEGTKDWEATVCPLEHLLARGKKMSAQKKPQKGKGAKASFEKDGSEEDLPNDDEAISEEKNKV